MKNSRNAVIVRAPFGGDGYTSISNIVARAPRLSLQARGLLLLLGSHEEGWELSEKALVSGTIHGVDFIRSAMAELEEDGYIRRYRERLPNGRWGPSLWIITDTPALLESWAAQRIAEEAEDGRTFVPLERRTRESTKRVRGKPARKGSKSRPELLPEPETRRSDASPDASPGDESGSAEPEASSPGSPVPAKSAADPENPSSGPVLAGGELLPEPAPELLPETGGELLPEPAPDPSLGWSGPKPVQPTLVDPAAAEPHLKKTNVKGTGKDARAGERARGGVRSEEEAEEATGHSEPTVPPLEGSRSIPLPSAWAHSLATALADEALDKGTVIAGTRAWDLGLRMDAALRLIESSNLMNASELAEWLRHGLFDPVTGRPKFRDWYRLMCWRLAASTLRQEGALWVLEHRGRVEGERVRRAQDQRDGSAADEFAGGLHRCVIHWEPWDDAHPCRGCLNDDPPVRSRQPQDQEAWDEEPQGAEPQEQEPQGAEPQDQEAWDEEPNEEEWAEGAEGGWDWNWDFSKPNDESGNSEEPAGRGRVRASREVWHALGKATGKNVLDDTPGTPFRSRRSFTESTSDPGRGEA